MRRGRERERKRERRVRWDDLLWRMRPFRKPGRYKRNLHSTYCREHPLVKSLSNIYPCLLKGLSLIAREVCPKKRNNIPFITRNFRGKKKRVRAALLLSLPGFHYFPRFRIHHATFPEPIHPFYHSIIRYSSQIAHPSFNFHRPHYCILPTILVRSFFVLFLFFSFLFSRKNSFRPLPRFFRDRHHAYIQIWIFLITST